MIDAFEVIRPFISPLSPYLSDPTVSEVMCNGSKVFIEREGRLEATEATINEGHLLYAVRQIARRLGDDITEQNPILDSRLPDGSRVAVVIPPCAVHGVALTIRKFRAQRFTMEELEATGSITAEQNCALSSAVAERKNILVSGGTSAGKTSLLNVLAALIPPDQRIVVIEDTAEIKLDHENKLNFEARRPLNGFEGVSVRQLLKAAMRHRPDRVILGEVRGAEGFDLLVALNSGHAGSMCSIHANDTRKALDKLTDYVLESNLKPYAATRSSIAHTIDVVAQLERIDGKRQVSEVVKVSGYEAAADRYRLEPLA
jgi:pilus assembly protein CpaF